VNVRGWFSAPTDRFLTIKVITDTGATTRNLVVSLRTVARAKIASVTAAALLVIGTFAIVDAVIAHRRIGVLESHNLQLREATGQMADLRRELADIWIINERLQRLLGASRVEPVTRSDTRPIPWGAPLARWAGVPFGIVPTDRPDRGVQLATEPGALVLATAAGVVRDIRWSADLGNVMYIDHGDGIQSVYARDMTMFARPGDRVRRGQTIGAIHATGAAHTPALFYRIVVDGNPVNPLVAMTEVSNSPAYPD